MEVFIDPTPAVDKPDAIDEHWIVPEFVGQLLDKLNKD